MRTRVFHDQVGGRRETLCQLHPIEACHAQEEIQRFTFNRRTNRPHLGDALRKGYRTAKATVPPMECPRIGERSIPRISHELIHHLHIGFDLEGRRVGLARIAKAQKSSAYTL